MNEKKTFIVIVTFNALSWLDKCIGSIDSVQYDVVVVDNNSKDGTVHYLKENYPFVHTIAEKENLGYGQGNNKGISYALQQGAEHVFLLNQDAYLINDCLNKLVIFQKNNPDYGILSPIHTNYNFDSLDPSFAKYMRFENNPDFYSDFVLGNKIKSVYDTPFINAAGWLVSRNCFEKVGGFDPIFFHYGEDINFCQRVLYHNQKIGAIPNAYMGHYNYHVYLKNNKSHKKNIFDSYQRFIKTKYANINSNDNLNIESKKLFKKLMLSLFLLKHKNFVELLKCIKLYYDLKPKIIQSIESNKKTGSNYLNLKESKIKN